MELESGEYFLAQAGRNKRQKATKLAQQADRVAEKKRKRMDAFAPPKVGHPSVLLLWQSAALLVWGSQPMLFVLQETAVRADTDAAKAARGDLADLTQSLKRKSKRGEIQCPTVKLVSNC